MYVQDLLCFGMLTVWRRLWTLTVRYSKPPEEKGDVFFLPGVGLCFVAIERLECGAEEEVKLVIHVADHRPLPRITRLRMFRLLL